ncbi:class I SAM-dependent methyltransferase [Pedobacter sandarakinus]|uniref:class I SAM-dependent methyltransferase n=1 Tax=Pedobacter sandarakinus TaxID=353156 RepID=UPI002247E668|nr:class I SAM-dependent methyltransferase [Pedobacter sandarakinus]MCX2575925.1 class I SAM-dependent methyltransferase [Pedobacter sandarakinus]
MLNRETHLARLSDSEIGKGHSLYLHYKFYHEALFLAIKQYANGQLLDIGCGNMPYKKQITPYVQQYVGCDIIQSSDNCVEILCPANQIPLADQTFDTVLSTQTIEHVEDHQGLVNEAYRLLKGGGNFIVSGPMYWPLHEEPYDFFRFTKHGLNHILTKAGFEVLALNPNGGKWAVAGQALIHAVFPTLVNIKGFKGKIVKIIFQALGGIKTINWLFSYLDQKAPDYTNTMNYVVVARKPIQ